MKKQEEAVGENEEEETLEQCMARVKAENPEITDEDARAKCTSQPAPEEAKGLVQKIEAVITEAMEAKFKVLEKRIEDRMAVIVKAKEDEAVDALRKGLGLSKDPVIHLSEMESMVRKILLEEKPHGKRTETDTKEKPVEGAEGEPKKLPKSEDMYTDLMKNKGGL